MKKDYTLPGIASISILIASIAFSIGPFAGIVSLFILGYAGIAGEHGLKIDKQVPALIMAAAIWAAIAILNLPTFEITSSGLHQETIETLLGHHLNSISGILFFLIGAMTIVEIIDHFKGFDVFKKFITTRKKKFLLWIVAGLAFVLSAIIDNLTTTIILITLLQKIIPGENQKELRLWFAGIIVISANAGGAWSPIGDVTTTMLWMAGKVQAEELMQNILVPSLGTMMIATLFASFQNIFKGNIPIKESEVEIETGSTFMLILGLALILFVPFFKTITHLPPYMGMIFGLGLYIGVAEFLTHSKFSLLDIEGSVEKPHSPGHLALSRIEMPSILFFLGILLAVAGLESLGLIFEAGKFIENSIGMEPFVVALGFLSAIIDNVPLVAASLGMFQSLANNHSMWHFIAYTAGTGGSLLIIGSAAGVVAMGLEKINFFWYLKNIAPLALLGYGFGILIFLFTH